MMQGTTASCPHCGISNPVGAAFCGSCGKALPLGESGPRVVSNAGLPASSAGAKLMGDELTKQMKSAANTLLIVGIIQWIIGGIVLAVVMGAGRVPPARAIGSMVQIGVVGAIFIGLYFWARIAPLPATIVGLVVYGTLIVINVVTQLSAMAQNQGGPVGIGGCGVGWLDIVIIIFLARGVTAALKYRKLLAAQSQV